MFFRRFFFVMLFGLVLIVGLSSLRHNSGFARGYEQGYAAAAQDFAAEPAASAAAETASQQPSAPAAPYRPGWGMAPIFGLFSFLFKFFLVFAAFAFFMKLLFFGCRRRWRGHKSGPWGHHRHGGKWGAGPGSHPGHHNRPQKGDDDYEKQPEDVEPDVRRY